MTYIFTYIVVSYIIFTFYLNFDIIYIDIILNYILKGVQKMSSGGYLLMKALAKKEDDERRARASSEKRKKQLEEDKKSRRRASYAKESFSYQLPYIDCVIKEMLLEKERFEDGEVKDNNKISLISFCEEFKKTFDEISLEDAAPLLEEAEEIKKEIDQAREKRLKLEECLGDKLRLIEKLNLHIVDMEKEEKEPSRFREKYNYLIRDEAEDVLLKKIEKLEYKIKYFPFEKKANQIRLEEIKEKLKKIQKAKLEAEEFESLSEEDKKMILEYLNSEATESHYRHSLERNRYKIGCVRACSDYNGNGCDYKKLRYRRERTLGRMLSEGKISDEYLDLIYRKLDKVGIKGRRGEYSPKELLYYGVEATVLDYKGFLMWFIDEVYEQDEHFVERNTQVEEEYEPAD